MLSVRDIANRELLDLVPYEPGKPVDDVARELGLDPASIIKLASNENPLGPSPRAVEAMREAIDKVHFYPDGGGFHLRNAIAEQVRPRRARTSCSATAPTRSSSCSSTPSRGPASTRSSSSRHAFAVYTLMAQLFGVRAIVVDDVDFTPDLPAMLRAVTPQTRLIFLASAEQPDRHARDQRRAGRLPARRCRRTSSPCSTRPTTSSSTTRPTPSRACSAGERVVLMRTFSKIQGLAGLRIGYGLASAEIADLLQRARQPFNANSIAQAGAIAGLADVEHQRKTKAITDEGRALLENDLRADGAEVRALLREFRARPRRRRRRGLQAPDEKGHHRPLDGELSPARIHPRQRRHAGTERALPAPSCPRALEGLVTFTSRSRSRRRISSRVLLAGRAMSRRTPSPATSRLAHAEDSADGRHTASRLAARSRPDAGTRSRTATRSRAEHRPGTDTEPEPEEPETTPEPTTASL